MYPYNIAYEKYCMVQVSLIEADTFLSLLVAYCILVMYLNVFASFVMTLGIRIVDLITKCETPFFMK